MISVLKFSHLLTALIFLTSYLVVKTDYDIVKFHSGIKVEKSTSALKLEKKNKIADYLFWIPEIQTIENLVSKEIFFSQTNVTQVVNVSLGFTARPPPVSLA